MLLPSLVQVSESISGSVVPLAMFYICSKRRLSFYPSFDIVSPARALVHIEEWETRIVSMCQECSGSTHSSFCSLFSSSSSLGSKSWDSASRSSPTKPSLKFSTQLLPFAWLCRVISVTSKLSHVWYLFQGLLVLCHCLSLLGCWFWEIGATSTIPKLPSLTKNCLERSPIIGLMEATLFWRPNIDSVPTRTCMLSTTGLHQHPFLSESWGTSQFKRAVSPFQMFKGKTHRSAGKTRDAGEKEDKREWWVSWKVWEGPWCVGSICKPTFSSGSSISPTSTTASGGGTFSSAGPTDSSGILSLTLYVEHWPHIRAGEVNLGLFKQLFFLGVGTGLFFLYTPEFSLQLEGAYPKV